MKGVDECLYIYKENNSRHMQPKKRNGVYRQVPSAEKVHSSFVSLYFYKAIAVNFLKVVNQWQGQRRNCATKMVLRNHMVFDNHGKWEITERYGTI